ncbi:MAG: sugar ABC transporter ATP-binding protein [Armatimonadetes bacterium]|nr:sugar ABC transporter ATP-binding protein [Armatimonadota bacterium]
MSSSRTSKTDTFIYGRALTTPVPTQPVLEMRGICKSYPGVRALDSVDFTLMPGEVHALVGENGAGKSTLMKILAGAQPRDSGDILINGRHADIDGPLGAMELGIAIIYQELNLVPFMTVAENIFLGREPKGMLPGTIGLSEMYTRCEQILEEIGARIPPNATVGRLSVAHQQMVEIAKAVSRSARIIAMDEPSATLTEHELESLFSLIRRLKSEGVGIIYISHRLEEIFEIADRVTVLRDGQFVGARDIDETDRSDIIRMMVGRELAERTQRKCVEPGDPVLSVTGLTRVGVLKDVSFTLRKGEILGIAGLVGAGRTEVARAIFGADPVDAGEIRIEGRRVNIRSPRDAIRLGIGLVTEDRKSLGLILGMAIRENTTLADLRGVSRWGFMNSAKERELTEAFVADLGIKTPSIDQAVQHLSGGNQQKVVLAKWLLTQSKALIFDEPTRGIDVAAKAEIYELMNRLTERGAGIIMISSELPEILTMSDRILVMHEGQVAGVISRDEATQETIMHMATGGA